MQTAVERGEIDAVYLAYTRFINTMKQEPVMEQLLPLSGEKLGVPEGSWDYIYEPEPQGIFEQLLPRYVEVQVYKALLESNAAFFAAQMTAMDTATKNRTVASTLMNATSSRAHTVVSITFSQIELDAKGCSFSPSRDSRCSL